MIRPPLATMANHANAHDVRLSLGKGHGRAARGGRRVHRDHLAPAVERHVVGVHLFDSCRRGVIRQKGRIQPPDRPMSAVVFFPESCGAFCDPRAHGALLFLRYLYCGAMAADSWRWPAKDRPPESHVTSERESNSLSGASCDGPACGVATTDGQAGLLPVGPGCFEALFVVEAAAGNAATAEMSARGSVSRSSPPSGRRSCGIPERASASMAKGDDSDLEQVALSPPFFHRSCPHITPPSGLLRAIRCPQHLVFAGPYLVKADKLL